MTAQLQRHINKMQGTIRRNQPNPYRGISLKQLSNCVVKKVKIRKTKVKAQTSIENTILPTHI